MWRETAVASGPTPPLLPACSALWWKVTLWLCVGLRHAQMRVSLLPSLIATFVVLHGGVKLRQKRSEASGHLLSSLPNYLSSWRGMKTDRAGLAAKWRWSRSGQRGMQTSGEGGWEGVFGGEVQAERDRMTGSERAREWIEVKGRERGRRLHCDGAGKGTCEGQAERRCGWLWLESEENLS